jgi:DNA-binding response OmpR family regulator
MPDVLIASDSPSVVDEVTAAITGSGTTTRTVPTGVEVLPEISRQRPDLVVLDQQMGNMGGFATCLALRLEQGADRLEPVPVLLLLDRRADVFLARRSGADGWVMKPLDPIRLRRAVTALLDGGTYLDPTGAPRSSATVGPPG